VGRLRDRVRGGGRFHSLHSTARAGKSNNPKTTIAKVQALFGNIPAKALPARKPVHLAAPTALTLRDNSSDPITVAFVAGGALVVLGGVLWLTAPKAASPTSGSVRLVPSVDARSRTRCTNGRSSGWKRC